MQVVAGPRQVGKTTLVRQVLEDIEGQVHLVSADEPVLHDAAWLSQQWETARLMGKEEETVILAIDEIQKVPGWAETVKRLWDEDTISNAQVKVVLLGSAALPIQYGLSESLAGRFEILRLPHWSAKEMAEAFGWPMEQTIFYGAYPGAVSLAHDHGRWRRYIIDSLIETTLSRDVLLLSRIDKPILLRHLFELGCRYSGQILSFNKMLGQLQDAGNTVTLAHYLNLLDAAGMLTGIRKFAGATVRQRGSSPKWQVYNNALLTALSPLSFPQAHADKAVWGRLVESAVGAHLANLAFAEGFELFYWRNGNYEVDFVVRSGKTVVAIEVKSGSACRALPGMKHFIAEFHPDRTLLVGTEGIGLEEFFSMPTSHWLR
jgi:hypothetical protein